MILSLSLRASFMLLLCSILNDKCHVLFVGQTRFLALPKASVNGERVNRHRQMFRVYLRETFST